MSLADRLFRLQQLDQESDTKSRRLAEVHREMTDTRQLEAAKSAEDAASALALSRTVRQTDLELELQGLVNKTTRETDRLFGGSVRNPKVLEDLQEEIASLQRRQAALEDDLLQTMIDGEDADAALAEARLQLQAAEASSLARQSELEAEKLALEQRIARIAKERAVTTRGVGAAELANYESLRSRKGGLAVARVVGETCTACGVAVSKNRAWHIREGDLVHCANCERILALI